MSSEERIEELERENAALRKELEKLRREIEERKRGFRERGKRRTSRGEGRERGTRKEPGRQSGHPAAHRPIPAHIDHEQMHATPVTCPCCDGPVELTEEMVSTLEVDVPPVKPDVTRHRTVVGRCARRASWRHCLGHPRTGPRWRPSRSARTCRALRCRCGSS